MPDRVSAADAAEVLAVAAIYDDRLESEVAAVEWAGALTAMGLTAHEAAAAVRQHYIDAPDVRVKPGHLRPIVDEWRRERAVRERTAAALAIEPGRPTGAEAAAVHARLRKTIADAVAAKQARDAAAQDTAADLAPSDGGWNFRPVEGGGWYSGPDPHPRVTPKTDPGDTHWLNGDRGDEGIANA